ncbi:uncharacterized protein LOC108161683 [Drosophila miranda]|uniref:uncharacterized protein LOC108161683 n=1 Tax=Drosophila miranda TaxID=7229 RepID=UPI0007E6860B|nr:uncharacterized protein LOC108161683 [Drosophila miranda]XP_017151483.1 uncharacterized protein LOC108161683 [Drosophila miranda]XP_017151484.1 uncharacterized protein LOC108161683 [Drosophila miranda]
MIIGELFANLLLIAACIYTMRNLSSAEHPYGYVVAGFCLVEGIAGLLRALPVADVDEGGFAFVISSTILEVMPLPMANIEFYLKSDLSGVAMLHLLTIIPLIYDVVDKILDDSDPGLTEWLKDLALLGNIGSMAYLANNDDNNPVYFGVVGISFFGRYAADHICFLKDFGCNLAIMTNAGTMFLMTYALTAPPK